MSLVVSYFRQVVLIEFYFSLLLLGSLRAISIFNLTLYLGKRLLSFLCPWVELKLNSKRYYLTRFKAKDLFLWNTLTPSQSIDTLKSVKLIS